MTQAGVCCPPGAPTPGFWVLLFLLPPRGLLPSPSLPQLLSTFPPLTATSENEHSSLLPLLPPSSHSLLEVLSNLASACSSS